MTTITFDIEANNLLNNDTIDYCASPYVLKPSFEMHCIVVENWDTNEIIAFYNGDTYVLDGREYNEEIEGLEYPLFDYDAIEYEHLQLQEFPDYIKSNKFTRVVGHNIINYDLLACKLFFGMDYTVGDDTWDGNDTYIADTMLLSKTLNADRFGGHSLEAIAKSAGKSQKVEFRKGVPKSLKFKHFAADMLYYCIFDCKANTAVQKYLEWEQGDWNWYEAIEMEKKVADIVTRSSHRGLDFDLELAEANIRELDTLLEERRIKVEPMLPMKKATKGFMKAYTPPQAQVLYKKVTAPKKQFKGDRSLSATLLKFIDKWNGTLSDCNKFVTFNEIEYKLPLDTEQPMFEIPSITSHMQVFIDKHQGVVNADVTEVELLGKKYSLPMAREPIVTEMVATIDDTTHIKDWLVGLNWRPSEYKMKDITLKSSSKIKRDPEDLLEAIDKYVDETFACNFCEDRLEHLGVKRKSKLALKKKLLDKTKKWGCKVLTNPSFTIGQEKELCPNLEQMAETFPYAKDVVEYLTYKHRRSSILGGGLEWEDEGEADKGYMAHVRDDGRIATEADTCGCGTGRMKHKKVANIPRVTSLYGKEMRGMFGVDKDYMQIGYDFDSLEAKKEAHYCWRYDQEGKPYCESLILPKPLDVHTAMSKAIAEVLGKPFKRGPAKSVKYGATFGAKEKRIATIIGGSLEEGTLVLSTFWDKATPLKELKEALTRYWKEVGGKKFILGLDGRKIPTRFEHALLNSLLQGGGVICAKRTMIFHDQLLKDEGLYVDFFVDDWANLTYMQQLIAYHDEAQLEVPKEEVKYKIFATKEEAQEFKDSSNKVWSDIVDMADGRVFIGYTRGAELISMAVDMTTEYYNLNVPLSAGYIIGRNWADCH